MFEPPAKNPPELEARLARGDDEYARKQWRLSSLSFASFFPFLPLALVQGVRDAFVLGLLFALAAVMIGVSEWNRVHKPRVALAIMLSCTLLAVFSRVFSAFVVVPSVACVMMVSFLSYPGLQQRAWMPISALVAALVGPFILEQAGVLDPTWHVTDDAFVLTGDAMQIGGVASIVMLSIATIGTLLVQAMFVRGLVINRVDAQRKTEIQAWHLSKLLPGS